MKLGKRSAAGRITALVLTFLMLFTSCALAQTTYETLEYGARGSDVLKLQKALLAAGFNPGDLDGSFGRGTERAVKLYQESVGLTADGKAGSKTLSTLYKDTEGSSDTSGDDSGSSGSDTGSSGSTTSTTSTTSRVSTNPDTLEYGDSGDKVTALQTALVKLGYNTNGVDGRFGAGTRKAVSAFQKANGLTADGLAGTRTQTLLYSKAGDTETGTGTKTKTETKTETETGTGGLSRTLRKGCTGSDVTGVQTKLQALGYYANSLDGVYGTGTMAAVSAFQKNNNLSVDGLVGSRTYAKLVSSSAVGSTGSGTDTGSESGTGSDTGEETTTYASLSYGATGEAVRNLQNALKKLGYFTGSVDGDYGALTQTAITKFQKLNGLTADGVAGALTQKKLYGGTAVEYDGSLDETTTIGEDVGKATGPSISSVKCLYWYTEVKPNLSNGNYLTVFDPATNLQWTLRVYSCGHHADSEPLTATDTAIQYKAFGYVNTWTPKPVYVKLPSGTWTLATMHNVPHLSGSIKDNNFDGHLCVHFLRTLEECTANDPDYGMTHQKAIRKKWKAMTGLDIAD